MKARTIFKYLGVSLLLLPSMVMGGEWEKGASIQLGSYYTTNVCLVNSDSFDEEDKAVATFRPDVRVSGSGSRFNLNLNAAAEYNSLGNSSVDCPQGGAFPLVGDIEPWVPSVNADATFEAVEDWVDFYAGAFASQNPVNPFLAGGGDNANALGNTNLLYQWRAGARVDRGLPNNWRLRAEAGHNRQYNSQNQAIGNSEEDRASYDLGREPFAARFFYGSRGNYSEIEFEESDFQEAFTNRLVRAEVYAGVTLTQEVALSATYGSEDNVFTSQDEDIDGSYWDVGIQWRPLSRIDISAGYGERFFGNTPRFNISYRHKRSVLSANYLRDIQFPRNIRATSQDPDLPDGFIPPGTDIPVLDVPGDPLTNDGSPTFAGNSPVRNDSFALSYALSGRRTSFSLSANISEQLQLATGQEAEFQAVNASLSRRMGYSFTGVVSGGWNQTDLVNTAGAGQFGGGFDGWTFRVGLSRPLARATGMSLNYVYTDQESDEFAINNFREQRITLTVTHTF